MISRAASASGCREWQAAGGADVAVLSQAHGAARSKGRVELIRRK